MIDYRLDDRIVLTLDAGGTNMVFGAMKGGEYIVEPLIWRRIPTILTCA